jgi:hypothetical protein
MKNERGVDRDPTTGAVIGLECTRCRQTKTLDRFSKGKGVVGKRCHCKDCERRYQQNRHPSGREPVPIKIPSTGEQLKKIAESLGLDLIRASYLKAHGDVDEKLTAAYGDQFGIFSREIRDHVDGRFFLGGGIRDDGELVACLERVDEMRDEVARYEKMIAQKEIVIESFRGIQQELAEERRKNDALRIAMNNLKDRRP